MGADSIRQGKQDGGREETEMFRPVFKFVLFCQTVIEAISHHV